MKNSGSKRCLVTGGCGFVGHHLVEHLLRNTDWRVLVLDKLTYASNGFERLRDISAYDDRRVTVLTADFCQPISLGVAKELGALDYIVHMGADTHVDNSIDDPTPFVMSNVLGTMHLLNFARGLPSLERMIYFSTDEVFGPAAPGVAFKEWDRYNSSNPYAATKAGGEELCLAYANTYKTPVMITHTMNVFGERQHPEKFIPKVVRHVLSGSTMPIHADPGRTKPGSRFYIHARNVADAVTHLLRVGQTREKYNIVGEREVDNLTLATMIAQTIGKPLRYELVDFHCSRPGHDLRYALDGSKLASMGWSCPKTFEESLEKCVRWMLDRPEYLEI
jgi:dTDP-glucose 4,6-dehydratase